MFCRLHACIQMKFQRKRWSVYAQIASSNAANRIFKWIVIFLIMRHFENLLTFRIIINGMNFLWKLVTTIYIWNISQVSILIKILSSISSKLFNSWSLIMTMIVYNIFQKYRNQLILSTLALLKNDLRIFTIKIRSDNRSLITV